MRAAKGKPSLVEERFMQKCRAFEISPFSNEDRLNLRTVSEYTRKRLEKKVDERHGWALKEKTTELHTQVVDHLNQKAKWLADKNAARKRAKNERLKHEEQLEKVGGALNKLQGRVMDAETEKKTLSRQLVHEMGRSKASDAVKERVQTKLDAVHVGMDNLWKENEHVLATLAKAKEENVKHKRDAALASKECVRVGKEMNVLKAARQTRLAAEERVWKKLGRQKDNLEQKLQDQHHVCPLQH
jgi:hypothetical protein